MINTKYIEYIAEDKRDEVYRSLVRDIYYFYYGMKPNENETIICINGIKYDIAKHNLEIVNTF